MANGFLLRQKVIEDNGDHSISGLNQVMKYNLLPHLHSVVGLLVAIQGWNIPLFERQTVDPR